MMKSNVLRCYSVLRKGAKRHALSIVERAELPTPQDSNDKHINAQHVLDVRDEFPESSLRIEYLFDFYQQYTQPLLPTDKHNKPKTIKTKKELCDE